MRKFLLMTAAAAALTLISGAAPAAPSDSTDLLRAQVFSALCGPDAMAAMRQRLATI